MTNHSESHKLKDTLLAGANMNNLTLQQPIGILGGTFDPVHLGHIQIAKQALNKCLLNKVLFIPCYEPAHKNKPIASPQQRLTMLNQALEAYHNMVVDDREMTRKGVSYMIDTLQSLKTDFPKTPLCLILGADAFANLNTWHKWQQLFDYANFIIINRPNANPEIQNYNKTLLNQSEVSDPIELSKNQNGVIYQLHISPIPISATDIRKKLKNRETILSMLPKKVFTYIMSEKIYL